MAEKKRRSQLSNASMHTTVKTYQFRTNFCLANHASLRDGKAHRALQQFVWDLHLQQINSEKRLGCNPGQTASVTCFQAAASQLNIFLELSVSCSVELGIMPPRPIHAYN